MSEPAAPEAQGSTEVVPPQGDTVAETLRGAWSDWLRRLRAGDLGALPIFVGLAALAVLFSALDDSFYTDRNFVNLLLQTAGVATIAIGVVFVLLIAEIDLSVGFVSGVCAVIMVLLSAPATVLLSRDARRGLTT